MDTTPLNQRVCVACEGGTPPLARAQAEAYVPQVPDWTLSEDAKSISRTFRFKDFKKALVFVQKVAAVAEAEGHHPDIHWSWNRVRLEHTTHAIKGLSDNDFILAAKIDRIG